MRQPAFRWPRWRPPEASKVRGRAAFGHTRIGPDQHAAPRVATRKTSPNIDPSALPFTAPSPVRGEISRVLCHLRRSSADLAAWTIPLNRSLRRVQARVRHAPHEPRARLRGAPPVNGRGGDPPRRRASRSPSRSRSSSRAWRCSSAPVWSSLRHRGHVHLRGRRAAVQVPRRVRRSTARSAASARGATSS